MATISTQDRITINEFFRNLARNVVHFVVPDIDWGSLVQGASAPQVINGTLPRLQHAIHVTVPNITTGDHMLSPTLGVIPIIGNSIFTKLVAQVSGALSGKTLGIKLGTAGANNSLINAPISIGPAQEVAGGPDQAQASTLSGGFTIAATPSSSPLGLDALFQVYYEGYIGAAEPNGLHFLGKVERTGKITSVKVITPNASAATEILSIGIVKMNGADAANSVDVCTPVTINTAVPANGSVVAVLDPTHVSVKAGDYVGCYINAYSVGAETAVLSDILFQIEVTPT